MSRFQNFMTRRFGGAMTVTYDSNKDPRVTLHGDAWRNTTRQVLTGDEAKAFLKKFDRRTNVISLLFLPLSAVFWIIVGIHNGTEWLLRKFMGEK